MLSLPFSLNGLFVLTVINDTMSLGNDWAFGWPTSAARPVVSGLIAGVLSLLSANEVISYARPVILIKWSRQGLLSGHGQLRSESDRLCTQ